MSRDAYGFTRSRYRPPRSRPTGWPVVLPRMSQRAMSMPLMVWVIDPPRPCQNVCWWSFSLTRSGSSAFSPRAIGSSRASDARTSSSLVKTLPTPVMPSSVWTAISVWTQVSGRSSLLHPPSGVAPRSPTALISRIFIALPCPIQNLADLGDHLTLDDLRAPRLADDVAVVRRRQLQGRIVDAVGVVEECDPLALRHLL